MPTKSDETVVYLWPNKRKADKEFDALTDQEAAEVVADALRRPFRCEGCGARSATLYEDGYCGSCWPWVWLNEQRK